MIKTAWQLKDRIRNLAKNKSADAQVLMRNYMMERFLERISVSEYRDKFILKGGMLVAAMIGLESRTTMDIDGTVNQNHAYQVYSKGRLEGKYKNRDAEKFKAYMESKNGSN